MLPLQCKVHYKDLKNIITHIILCFMTALYLVSTMGLGIHECIHEGTKESSILFASKLCRHDNDAGADNSCGMCSCCNGSEGTSGHNHSDNCCTTEIYVVSYDQLSSHGSDEEEIRESAFQTTCEIGPALLAGSDCKLSHYAGINHCSGFIKQIAANRIFIATSQFRI